MYLSTALLRDNAQFSTLINIILEPKLLHNTRMFQLKGRSDLRRHKKILTNLIDLRPAQICLRLSIVRYSHINLNVTNKYLNTHINNNVNFLSWTKPL